MITNPNKPGPFHDFINRRIGFPNLRTGFISACIALGVIAMQVYALSVQQFELRDLCARADKIVRAKVLDVSAGSIAAGGGQIPVTAYRLEVKETLAGGESAVIDLKVVGNLKAQTGNIRRIDLLGDVPRLERGNEYLLFTTKPSKVGLSTFVGLGQGCFSIFSQDKKEVAVNGAGNNGLGLEKSGPAAYAELVRKIRELRNR